MTDIIIIGAGPAGMTAAIYSARAGKSVIVFEKDAFGGQISKTDKIENYPGIKSVNASEFSMSLYSQCKTFGAQFIQGEVSSVKKGNGSFVVTANGKDYECKKVIFAPGAKPKKLGLENEEELAANGISYCAVCDGALYKGLDTAVVGGGQTAFQDALMLSELCSKVYLIHRRDAFRADSSLVERVKKQDNIILLTDSIVTSAEGNGAIQSITVKNTKTEEEKKLPISGLFVAIGYEPATKGFSDILPLDSEGFVECGEDCRLGENLYVCGDCRQKQYRQLTTAVSDGTTAALSACE